MAPARTQKAHSEEAAEVATVGGERIDANGKRWQLASLSAKAYESESRPHCAWCDLFIDVFAYFECDHDYQQQRALHEDCFQIRDSHIRYMRERP